MRLKRRSGVEEARRKAEEREKAVARQEHLKEALGRRESIAKAEARREEERRKIQDDKQKAEKEYLGELVAKAMAANRAVERQKQ